MNAIGAGSRGLGGVRAPGAVTWIGAAAAFTLLVYAAGTAYAPPFGGVAALTGLLAAATAAWLLVERPGIFLVVFLGYATFAPIVGRIAHLPFGWFKGIFFMALFPLWALSRVLTGRSRSYTEAIRLPLLCYAWVMFVMAALAALALLRGVPPLLVLDTLKAHLLYPVLLFIGAEVTTSRRGLRRFIAYVVGLTVCVAAGAIIQSFMSVETLLSLGLSLETGSVAFVAIDPISGKMYQRLFSILDDQSAVAAFALLGIAACLYLVLTAPRRTRPWLLAALGLNAYALILTYNITTLLATILLIAMIVLRLRSTRILVSFLAIAALVSTLAVVRYGELISHRLSTSFSLRAGVSTSLVSRVESNRRAIRMAMDHPLIGEGLGSTANYFVYYRLGARSSAKGGFTTDNFYMTTLLETGLVGLASLAALHALPLIALAAMRRRRVVHPDDLKLVIVAESTYIVFLLMNFSNGQMNTNPTNLVYWAFAGALFRAKDWAGLDAGGARAAGSR